MVALGVGAHRYLVGCWAVAKLHLLVIDLMGYSIFHGLSCEVEG